ncbi:MAG TPA: zf-HC2 domain-containing protein [Mycobacteriales bacterium]|nr:zf-HC2 domain-containing protein [Mycobacteriales bacterium]
MTLPDVHLAEEAIAAYADGVLSSAACDRAERHLRGCASCRAAVEAQCEAKVMMAAAPDPELPTGLMARLLQVPMTADLGGGDLVLAVDHGEFVWAPAARAPAPVEPRVVERSRLVAPAAELAVAGPAGRRPNGAARPAGPSGPGQAAARPAQRPAPFAVSAARLRRGRRGLAFSLAGLAFGVIASAASTTVPNTAAPARPGGAPGSPSSQLVADTNAGIPVEARTFRVTGQATRQDVLGGSRSHGR